jgi:hypothetical protein
MAGFFGLFGKQTKYVDEPMDMSAPQPTEAFYLEPDDAKTLGNIDFMRKPKTIRRTFPKTASNQKGGESIKQISSMEISKVADNGIVAKSVNSEANGNGNGNGANGNGRRANDDSINPFLKMAREIKK